MSKFDRTAFDSGVFVDDLRRAASIISAPFDNDLVHDVVTSFEQDLARCVVQLKTSSDPLDGLYFRFFYTGSDDLIERADREGLRHFDPGRLDLFQARLMKTYPQAVQAGLDFHCATGLVKLWTNLGRCPMDELATLPFMPNSVQRSQAFFGRHGLRDCFFLATDYRHPTINIYAFLDPEYRTSLWLEEMLADTWPDNANVVDSKALVPALQAGACVGMTFSWDRPAMSRWALYGVNAPYLDAAFYSVLPPLPARLRAFADKSPTLSLDPHINVAWSFEPARCVVKFEKSYANSLPAATATDDPLFVELAG